MSQATVITLDGPSGSGKGTIAGLLAARLGWKLLDSGALYRLLAFAAGNHGIDLTNEEGLKTLAAHLDVKFIAGANGQGQRIILEGDEVTDVIRTETVGAGASQVAALPAVREALLQRQRAFRAVKRLRRSLLIIGNLRFRRRENQQRDNRQIDDGAENHD